MSDLPAGTMALMDRQFGGGGVGWIWRSRCMVEPVEQDNVLFFGIKRNIDASHKDP